LVSFAVHVDLAGAQEIGPFQALQTRWLANPGPAGDVWKEYLAVEKTGNESPDYVDVDGDGQRERLFIKGSRCSVASPAADPTHLWRIQAIAGPGDPSAVHGLGAGDLNRDGHLDALIPGGWWQGPSGSTARPWTFHEASFFGGAQLCVTDVDDDGDNDVLGSSAHGYGIGWTEQTAEGWQQHQIDDTMSQTHAIHLADMNRDGRTDFVTGKRFWAHIGRDPRSFEPALLCWYQRSLRDGEPSWIKHEIDANSGVGLHVRIVDIDRNGRLDIVTANKRGLHVFLQQR